MKSHIEIGIINKYMRYFEKLTDWAQSNNWVVYKNSEEISDGKRSKNER